MLLIFYLPVFYQVDAKQKATHGVNAGGGACGEKAVGSSGDGAIDIVVEGCDKLVPGFTKMTLTGALEPVGAEGCGLVGGGLGNALAKNHLFFCYLQTTGM